jgi:hypothetical protein
MIHEIINVFWCDLTIYYMCHKFMCFFIKKSYVQNKIWKNSWVVCSNAQFSWNQFATNPMQKFNLGLMQWWI